MSVTQFFNNSAHSNARNGLHIFPSYLPVTSGCAGGGTSPQFFNNFSAWRNGGSAVYGYGAKKRRV